MSLILSGTDGLSDVDGSAATPAIRGTDTNTGIFFPAADTIAFAEGGAEIARFDSAGNMGLGVTPSAWASGTFPSVLQLKYGALAGTGDGNFRIFTNTVYDGSYKYIANGYASRMDLSSGGMAVFTAASGTAGNAFSFTQAMTLDANGRLGVGPTSPTTVLHTSSSTAGIYAQGTSTKTNNLLITCSNSYNYGVVGTVSGDNTSGGDIFGLGYVASASGSFTSVAAWTSGGVLLVGKTSDSDSVAGFKLSSNGSTYGRVNCAKTSSRTLDAWANYHNGSYVGGMTYSNTATAFPTSSDIRLKKDIVDAGSASARIDQIRIVSHGWKHDDEVVEFGVVAQELNLVAPQAVIAGDDGEEIEKTWGVDYSKLVPMLIKAHQEQQALIAQLQADVAALKGTQP